MIDLVSDRRAWPSMLAALAISAVVVLGSPFLRPATVADRAGQRDVAWGSPVAWVHQDQTSLSPSLPTHTGLLSPWQHPTTVSVGGLLVDLVVFLAVAFAALALLLLVVRRGRATPGGAQV